MSCFELNKRHLRELLIYFFDLKKSPTEVHRLLVEACDEAALSERSCRGWFQTLKNGEFDVEEKERSGSRCLLYIHFQSFCFSISQQSPLDSKSRHVLLLSTLKHLVSNSQQSLAQFTSVLSSDGSARWVRYLITFWGMTKYVICVFSLPFASAYCSRHLNLSTSVYEFYQANLNCSTWVNEW